MKIDPNLPIRTPRTPPPEAFRDAEKAVDRLLDLYLEATGFLVDRFVETLSAARPAARYRAYYPEIRFTTTSYAQADSRFSFGHVALPGTYATTITRPDLFRNYLIQQIGLLIANHDAAVVIGASSTPVPLHFAVAGSNATVPQEGTLDFPLRDIFDVPDLATTNDDIVKIGRAHV